MHSNTDIPVGGKQSELPDLVTGLRYSDHPAIVRDRRETGDGFADQPRFPSIWAVFFIDGPWSELRSERGLRACGAILIVWNAGSWVLAFAMAGRGVIVDLIKARRIATKENIATQAEKRIVEPLTSAEYDERFEELFKCHRSARDGIYATTSWTSQAQGTSK